ncbi:hypothetical protein ACJIZ3_010349 [Penstemon smallii]|uniref:RING-type domain-containing protein n=1 Tax=Penstemon smallii TaxID=265156 RepID=A0ABD3TGH8_9LAMI
MGLSNYPTPSDGMLLLVIMNTIVSVTLINKILKSMLRVIGVGGATADEEVEYSGDGLGCSRAIRRGVSVRRYGGALNMECCVCLSGFRSGEEVSELSCKHFFHKCCLDKWFDNHHITCPLCRCSI